MSQDANLATYSVPIKPNTSLEGIFLYSGAKPEPKSSLISDQEIFNLQKTQEFSYDQLAQLGSLDGYTLGQIFPIPDSLKMRNRA